jgi:ThiF family
MTIASCTAQVLHADKAVLERLRADPVIEFIDHLDEQREELRSLRPPPDAALVAEPCRWAYYPWRRTVVALLGPRGFRAVRLDRNRNLINADEQTRLGALRIGVAGLSVGHVIAHTLAAEGLCGELRVADFDGIELSNLNRVPATVLDLGLNKAEVAARRIAELERVRFVWRQHGLPYGDVRRAGRSRYCGGRRVDGGHRWQLCHDQSTGARRPG